MLKAATPTEKMLPNPGLEFAEVNVAQAQQAQADAAAMPTPPDNMTPMQQQMQEMRVMIQTMQNANGRLLQQCIAESQCRQTNEARLQKELDTAREEALHATATPRGNTDGGTGAIVSK